MRRNRIDTLCDILTISTNGIKKTHILYRANLSYRQLEKFLEVLISKELLMKEFDSYKTTSKGVAFIEECAKIQSLLGESNKKSKFQVTETFHQANLMR